MEVIAALVPSGRSRMAFVPNVIGQSLENAQTAITAANLNIGVVKEQFSDSIPLAEVFVQDPPPKSTVPRGFSIDLVVSLA